MRSPTLEELPPALPGRTGWPWTEQTSTDPHTTADGAPWPKISIVTPSYNQGEFLEETIRSVLLQSYADLEYIIIDGGSTDTSIEIIKKYEKWLTHWVSEPDEGQTYAIHKGMCVATGELVNWLNSDDFLCPGALAALAQVFRKADDACCILCGDAFYLDHTTGQLSPSIVRPKEDKVLPMAPPYIGGIQASWFFSRPAWKAVGGIDLTLNYAMDTDLYFRSSAKGVSFVPVRYFVATYRKHPDTKTAAGWRESIGFKIDFYSRWLSQVPGSDRSAYVPRVGRAIFGFYLQSVSPRDGMLLRGYKIAAALRFYPRALLQPYQIKRLFLLLVGSR